MELNNMDILAMELCDKIEEVFGDKVETITAYDIVDQPNHHMFKLNFVAYDYFWIQCNYENDYFGFSIVLNDQFSVSLSEEKYAYSEILDWDNYLRKIMANIELRIPDKFLKAKGWI
ncbi:hypothetical protein ACVRXS_07685 [Streptococcus orisratti]|uniref:hypothetical protein n=1 Tax=Streptococcus orisratti TaxID=114652 RepID=UPI00035C9C14|nr:hypothetical protein [Streptococcus orisratti]